ncbi:MAG: FdtA/QdtA family cupin domain-containing protein [Ruthenibacterium sp.]
MNIDEQYRILNFKDMGDARGNLIVVEGEKDIPFSIQRVFYIYGSDSKVIRGQHANKLSEFVLINIAGTSKVDIDNGVEKRTIPLDAPGKGLYIKTMIWKDMYEFSPDSVLLVLANTHYDGKEYIRNYDEYLQIVKKEKIIKC